MIIITSANTITPTEAERNESIIYITNKKEIGASTNLRKIVISDCFETNIGFLI